LATVDRRGVSVDATDTAVAGDPNPGLAIKVACLVATTANITLSGVQAIDGVTVGNDAERVLVLNQTDPGLNGIYNASSGPWTRATDADGSVDLANGLQVLVIEGDINGGYKTYVCTSDDPVLIGSSDITFQALAFPNSSIEFLIDGGGGNPIIAGYFGVIEVPFDCQIVRSTVLADVSGNLQLDIRKTSYAGFPPAPANSIVASAPPKLTAAQSSQDSTLTGWTVRLSKGDLLAYYAVGICTVTKATSSLLVVRS
jgi:hypothetical protein